MDEEFLMSAMRQSGEENIISIKVKCDSSRIVYYVCVYVVLFYNDRAVVGMSQMSSIFYLSDAVNKRTNKLYFLSHDMFEVLGK